MKLKNKKTGEIIDDGYVRETHDFQFDGQKHVLAVFKGNGHRPPERVSGAYNSLAELNAEWEDYEEPKEFYFIDQFMSVSKGVVDDVEYAGRNSAVNYAKKTSNNLKTAGNYFETKEEAEKAVEKLKAWKRLKDKGFSIYSWDYEFDLVDKPAQTIILRASVIDSSNTDLDLLFGGEE